MTELTGVISSWDDDRGFGFIESAGRGGKIFLHIRDFSQRHRRPREGLAVRFAVSRDNRGRPRAVRVQPRREQRHITRTGRQTRRAIVICTGFYAALGVLVLLGEVPPVIPVYYALLGLITFALYTKDKSAARHGRWRTPENTLHLLSLAGGWAGALVAAALLRHKTAKIPFRVLYWLSALANVAALGWLLSPSGSALLDQLWELSAGAGQFL